MAVLLYSVRKILHSAWANAYIDIDASGKGKWVLIFAGLEEENSTYLGIKLEQDQITKVWNFILVSLKGQLDDFGGVLAGKVDRPFNVRELNILELVGVDTQQQGGQE